MSDYKDPLHIPSAELEVIVGKRGIRLSKALLDRQNAWGNLTEIKELHAQKMTAMNIMDDTDDPAELKLHAANITEIEFKLQDAWGFPRNENFHRFWLLPKCTCPHMDNEDAYPTGYYVTSGNCPIHGGK